jgi:hypothetical protein
MIEESCKGIGNLNHGRISKCYDSPSEEPAAD